MDVFESGARLGRCGLKGLVDLTLELSERSEGILGFAIGISLKGVDV